MVLQVHHKSIYTCKAVADFYHKTEVSSPDIQILLKIGLKNV